LILSAFARTLLFAFEILTTGRLIFMALRRQFSETADPGYD